MKKKVLLIASVFAASTLFAQDLTSRKGETYLPEANDWAISFDAAPFLTYAGGFLGGNASAPSVNYISNMPWHIRGKMFKDEKTAYRAGLRLAFGSDKYTAMTGQFNATAPTFPAAPSMVEDVCSVGGSSIVLSGGLEMRRGNTRLQGYYGGELFIGFFSAKNSVTYGNAMDAAAGIGTGQTDFTAIAGVANIGTDPFYGFGARMTESSSSSMTVGLRGFIGAEYFIMPKISIGAEYGWGLGIGNSKSSSTWETSNGTQIATIEDNTGTSTSSFGFDTDINYATSGQLNIIFHF